MDYENVYRSIEKNKLRFEKMLKFIDMKIIPFSLRFLLANSALKFAVYNQTGYFYSNKLERFYVDIAQKNDIKNYKCYQCLYILVFPSVQIK